MGGWKTPFDRERNRRARAGWRTNEDGKPRLRDDVGELRVSTREDSPRSFLTSVKPIAAARHEGYIDVAVSERLVDAERVHGVAIACARRAAELAGIREARIVFANEGTLARAIVEAAARLAVAGHDPKRATWSCVMLVRDGAFLGFELTGRAFDQVDQVDELLADVIADAGVPPELLDAGLGSLLDRPWGCTRVPGGCGWRGRRRDLQTHPDTGLRFCPACGTSGGIQSVE